MKESISCGCFVVVLLFNFIVGGIAVNFLIQFLSGTEIPFFWAGVIGLISGEIAVPAAAVLYILVSFNIVKPISG